MEWFNPFGLVFITIIIIPNIVFAIRCKDGFANNFRNKTVELVEQIGRFGCFGFMIFNIPGTWFGWASNEVFALYLILDALLVALYCILWIVCWKKNGTFKVLALSVIPSVVFLISGIMNTPDRNRQLDRSCPTPVPLKSYTLSAGPTPSV